MTLPPLPARATITDITLRDGLQSLPTTYSTAAKVALFETIASAGVRSIEVTSFMRPDRVPQLADAEAFLAAIGHPPGLEFRALVANRRGVERAVATGIDVISILVTLSDEYCRRNQGTDRAGNLMLARETIALARAAGKRTDISYSMPIFCPYEGPIARERLEETTAALLDAGADAFTLCTSTGLESPVEVSDRIARMRALTDKPLALHLHDTNGMAPAVTLAGLIGGINRFETALGGCGGGIALPSGMPGHGNFPTEDMAHLLVELGIDTGLDVEAIVAAAVRSGDILARNSLGRAAAGATKRAVLHMTGADIE